MVQQSPDAPDRSLIAGAIDLHVHAAPDVRARKQTMLEVAQDAAAAGMRAVVFKSHHEQTAGHAWLVQQIVPSIATYGGVVLNRFVGGLNIRAVETAALLGGRLVWMPTITATHHHRQHGEPHQDGLTVFDGSNRLTSEALDILDAVAARHLALATGHLSPPESAALAREARRRGVHAVLVTHPEMPFIDFPTALQQELAHIDGIFFERCYNAALSSDGEARPEGLAYIAQQIRTVGVDSTILSSDLGQPANPPPVAGFARYVRALRDQGISEAALDRMIRHNPARILGL